LWQEIVDASPDAWIWHTWAQHEYNLCAAEQFAAKDLSFFVYDGEKAIGVVPLIVQEKRSGDSIKREAIYYSGFLPWPAFRAEVTEQENVEDFAFSELEKRAREAGAQRLYARLTPPHNTGNEESRVKRIVSQNGYDVRTLEHHFTEVTPELLTHVRSRYDYKHFSPLFDLYAVEGSDVTQDFEEIYFELHVSDAGGQFRSRESYTKQMDLVRAGEGFHVVARHKETRTIAGAALILVCKGTGFYGAVAVDPDMRKLCVGYQLQCQAIEELLARGIRFYDLGPIADTQKESSIHEKNISMFKKKISGTGSRHIYSVQKLLQ
jgi:hypothetical protein